MDNSLMVMYITSFCFCSKPKWFGILDHVVQKFQSCVCLSTVRFIFFDLTNQTW
jgi:hypothetical protein